MEHKQYYVLNEKPELDYLFEEIFVRPGHVFQGTKEVSVSLETLNKLLPGLLTEVCNGCLFGGDGHPNPILRNL